MYKILANLVAALHLLFMVAFAIGIIISLQGKLGDYASLQIFLWLWIAAKTIFYLIFRSCVLTKLEQYLRRLAGEQSYTGGFIKHYLGKIGIPVSDATVVWIVVAPAVVAVASEIYRQYL